MQRKARHYKLLRELGRGAAGVIHLALDVEDDRLVALKHLSEQAAGRFRNAPDRFAREVRILRRLRHPNVVGIEHHGRADGRPYFAMEYVEGQTLEAMLDRGPLELGDALRITERVARALAYIHRHGIVHRDVKPANILLDAAGTPRLADFGLARDASEDDLELTASGMAVGTLVYASPEQCLGHSRRVDGRADVYSLGLVLAAALTRKTPSYPRTRADLCGRFAREYEVPLRQRGVPEDVIAICRRAIRFAPERRFPSAAAMARELRAVQRSPSIAAQQRRAG